MRLNPVELNTIRTTLRAVDANAGVYLYGSRADDNRRGGDIDLFLDATKSVDLKTALTLQYRLTTTLDTNVDLLIKSPAQSDLPIHQIARKGIRL